jgi:hypothetical protein
LNPFANAWVSVVRHPDTGDLADGRCLGDDKPVLDTRIERDRGRRHRCRKVHVRARRRWIDAKIGARGNAAHSDEREGARVWTAHASWLARRSPRGQQQIRAIDPYSLPVLRCGGQLQSGGIAAAPLATRIAPTSRGGRHRERCERRCEPGIG